MIKYIFLLLLLVACAEKKVKTSSTKDDTQAIMHLAMKEMLKSDVIEASKKDTWPTWAPIDVSSMSRAERVQLKKYRDSCDIELKTKFDTITSCIVLDKTCWIAPVSNSNSNEVYQFQPKKTVNKASEFYHLSQKVFKNQNDSMWHKCDDYFRYPKLTIVVKAPEITRETNQIGWLSMSQIEYNSKIDRAVLYFTYAAMSGGCIPSLKTVSFLFLFKKQNDAWKIVDKVDCEDWKPVLIKLKNLSPLSLPIIFRPSIHNHVISK
jgi:secreted Zn-dependent insulinase-like peptidase